VVDVVGEADGDASTSRCRQGAGDELRRVRLEPEVVEGEVERVARGAEENRDGVGDLERSLAAVDQRPDLDQSCFALRDAL
jgi:hypothetical protein